MLVGETGGGGLEVPAAAGVCLERRVFPVDEEAEGGQRCPQFGGLAAGCGEEGVVLKLLEDLHTGHTRRHCSACTQAALKDPKS